MSGKIDITNYEAWLLDYFEGNLSPEQITELKSFILIHPELDIDLTETELITLDSENLLFDAKEDLYKSTLIGEETLLDYLEGNLSDTEKSLVEQELSKNQSLASDFSLFQKTILIPDAEFFADKNSLLKTEEELILANRVIAYLEQELSAEEKQSFEAELQINSLLSSELSAYKQTLLAADPAIVFPDKAALKKEAKVVALFSYRTMAAAAAVLLVTGITTVMISYFSYTGSTSGLALKSLQLNTGDMSTNDRSARVSESLIANNSNKNSQIKPVSGLPAAKVIKGITDTNSIHNTILPEVNVAVQPVKSAVDSSAFAANTATPANKETVVKYTNDNVLALADDEAEPKAEKNGFWKRAVKFAQQVNGLGVKAVKGDEKNGEEYSLSFNSFSVEKK